MRIKLLFAVLFCISSVLWAAEPGICPRPVAGSPVTAPVDLRSTNGVLKADLEYHTSMDDQGRPRFCFLTKDGNLAPNLRLRPGDELILTLKNDLPTASTASEMSGHVMHAGCTSGGFNANATNLHFHGLVIAPTCHEDDTLNTAVQPSDSFEYKFKVPQDQPPGVYWYHPHIHGFAKTQILGGASGALIVEGIEAANSEIRGLPERILVVRDQDLINPDAEPIAVPGLPPPMVFRDAEGDVINTGTGTGKPAKDLSINFVPVSFPEYKPAIIRMQPSKKEFWRVLNASAITYVDVQVLYNEQPQALELIAIDGIPLNHEHPAGEVDKWRSHILLPPAARAEFIVTGPAAGVTAELITRSVDTGPVGDNDPVRPLATIQVDKTAVEPQRIPANTKSPLPSGSYIPLRNVKPVRQRLLYFSERPQDPNNPSSSTQFFLTVDGQTPQQFDHNSSLPNITVRSGDVEDWVIENRSKELHAFHIHQTHFQLLEWNGVPVGEPFLRDTINVPYWHERATVYPSVKIRMDFRDPRIVGTFAYHCHLLEHQDGGMMGLIRVEPRVEPNNAETSPRKNQ
ncbi:MAG TPA: multicopper oxidase domain-containing protein [Terriglobales bacterium]|nr:multicopper oxidase domain-containing protein [Terriglobales bacterium]